METFRYTGNDQKFIEENQAEIIDIIEGCLLDNYLLSTENGYIAMIETYVKCLKTFVKGLIMKNLT